MKATTKKRRNTAKKAPLKIAINASKASKPERCSNCGAIPHAKWIDWTTRTAYLWCLNPKCEAAVKAKVPKEVADSYVVRHRPCASLATFFGPSEIELVTNQRPDPKTLKDPVIIKGKNAQTCYDAWFNSIYPTDLYELLQLYKLTPRARYYIFDTDGKLHSKVKRYEDAEVLAGSDKVVVYWGGK